MTQHPKRIGGMHFDRDIRAAIARLNEALMLMLEKRQGVDTLINAYDIMQVRTKLTWMLDQNELVKKVSGDDML